jgi:ferric-dicitrate binding protein FerR (iron transport regulator)
VVNIGARSRPATSALAADEDALPGVSGQAVIGGLLAAGGVAAVWHGVGLRRLLDTADATAAGQQRTWLLWCGFGVVLVVIGVGVVIR